VIATTAKATEKLRRRRVRGRQVLPLISGDCLAFQLKTKNRKLKTNLVRTRRVFLPLIFSLRLCGDCLAFQLKTQLRPTTIDICNVQQK
jgi:hypothetical protein